MPDDGEFSQEIHNYFKRSSPKNVRTGGGVLSEKIDETSTSSK